MNIKLDYFYISAFDLEVKVTEILKVISTRFCGETVSGEGEITKF